MKAEKIHLQVLCFKEGYIIFKDDGDYLELDDDGEPGRAYETTEKAEARIRFLFTNPVWNLKKEKTGYSVRNLSKEIVKELAVNKLLNL